MINTLTALGLLPDIPKTKIRWHYLSRNTNEWCACKGHDGGASDAMKYGLYGYQIKAIQEQE